MVGYSFLTLQPVSAQDQSKYFKITDDGLYYFFNETTIEQNVIEKGANNYTRPITARTFFLEAKKANIFPEDFTFTEFQRLKVPAQQALLDSLQKGFDFSKYHLTPKEDAPDSAKAETKIVADYDVEADTTYRVENLAFNKESTTLYGDLVMGSTGIKQKFMVYPMPAKNKSVEWIFEWVELDLYLKKQGYKNLGLPELRIYQGLLLKGIDTNTLNALLQQ